MSCRNVVPIMTDVIDTGVLCCRLRSLGESMDSDLTNFLSSAAGVDCIQQASLSVFLLHTCRLQWFSSCLFSLVIGYRAYMHRNFCNSAWSGDELGCIVSHDVATLPCEILLWLLSNWHRQVSRHTRRPRPSTEEFSSFQSINQSINQSVYYAQGSTIEYS